MKRGRDKTLVFCVLYPGLSDSIVTDYVDSLVKQTDKRFDWLMINDNCHNDQPRLFPSNVTWIDVDTQLSFGKIREIGMSFAIHHAYDYIVLSDIDDYYSANRVELSKAYLKDSDFVFSELQVINMTKDLVYKDFISKLEANPSPASIHAILDRNYIGLSHSAVRVSALRGLEIPTTIEVVDWWLFSILLIENCIGRFLPEVNTFYRQSAENFVGVFNLLNRERLGRGIDVKLHHYGSLWEYCNRKQRFEMADILQQKYHEMAALRAKTSDEAFAVNYINVVNSHFAELYKGWWSEIVSLDRWAEL